MNKPKKFYKILAAISAICFVIIFTPLGFPYSGDNESPTPQRFWIMVRFLKSFEKLVMHLN